MGRDLTKPNRVRPATAQDAGMLKVLYKEAKKELGSFNLYQCWDFYLSGKNKDKFWVVGDIQSICGFVRWNWSKKFQANMVKDIAVLASMRGLGIGRELLQSVPLPIVLKCNADNFDGNFFYAKMGMVNSGTTQTRKGVSQNIWTINKW